MLSFSHREAQLLLAAHLSENDRATYNERRDETDVGDDVGRRDGFWFERKQNRAIVAWHQHSRRVDHLPTNEEARAN